MWWSKRRKEEVKKLEKGHRPCLSLFSLTQYMQSKSLSMNNLFLFLFSLFSLTHFLFPVFSTFPSLFFLTSPSSYCFSSGNLFYSFSFFHSPFKGALSPSIVNFFRFFRIRERFQEGINRMMMEIMDEERKREDVMSVESFYDCNKAIVRRVKEEWVQKRISL